MHENTTVELVEAACGGLRVVTDQGTWLARNVVVATGTENRAYVPPAARGIDPGIWQLTAGRYRGPRQIPDGGVLVVGASASGAQIADELRRAGRPVTLSVGRHARLPRRYRGRDILWWMDQAGVLDQTIDQTHDSRSARRAPSLQLSGRGHPVGLDALAAGGVRYQQAYPWLRVPVLDRHGQIAHHRGVTTVPGLYVLGLRFLYRRNSSFVDGVGSDARFVAAHLTRRMAAPALSA